jgi:hypothetical protein
VFDIFRSCDNVTWNGVDTSLENNPTGWAKERKYLDEDLSHLLAQLHHQSDILLYGSAADKLKTVAQVQGSDSQLAHLMFADACMPALGHDCDRVKPTVRQGIHLALDELVVAMGIFLAALHQEIE